MSLKSCLNSSWTASSRTSEWAAANLLAEELEDLFDEQGTSDLVLWIVKAILRGHLVVRGYDEAMVPSWKMVKVNSLRRLCGRPRTCWSDYVSLPLWNTPVFPWKRLRRARHVCLNGYPCKLNKGKQWCSLFVVGILCLETKVHWLVHCNRQFIRILKHI